MWHDKVETVLKKLDDSPCTGSPLGLGRISDLLQWAETVIMIRFYLCPDKMSGQRTTWSDIFKIWPDTWAYQRIR